MQWEPGEPGEPGVGGEEGSLSFMFVVSSVAAVTGIIQELSHIHQDFLTLELGQRSSMASSAFKLNEL